MRAELNLRSVLASQHLHDLCDLAQAAFGLQEGLEEVFRHIHNEHDAVGLR